MHIKFITGKLMAVVLFIILATVFLYSSYNSLSYDDKTTHPALTDENFTNIVDWCYNTFHIINLI